VATSRRKANDQTKHPAAPPCTLFLFGANGDLVKRLLMPALYNLSRDGLLDRNLRIVGVDHNAASAEAFAERLHAFMLERDQGREGSERCLDDKLWARLAKRLDYQTGDFLDPATYQALAKRIDKTSHGNAIFYLATSPRFFPEVAQRLGDAGLLDESAGGFGGWWWRTLRHRPGQRRSAERPPAEGDERAADLPHRPLPGQGDGAEHPGQPFFQRPVRVVLEQPLHRPRADHRGRNRRRRDPRRLL
jgi:hypothetical protein